VGCSLPPKRLKIACRPSNPCRCCFLPLFLFVQALLLRRMSVYFDTDAEFWQPIGGANWHELAPPEWDEWFQPGIGCACYLCARCLLRLLCVVDA
jgi:hypothetical protein